MAPPQLEIYALCRYILRNGLYRPERGELMHNVDNEATLGVSTTVTLAGLSMYEQGNIGARTIDGLNTRTFLVHANVVSI